MVAPVFFDLFQNESIFDCFNYLISVINWWVAKHDDLRDVWKHPLQVYGKNMREYIKSVGLCEHEHFQKPMKKQDWVIYDKLLELFTDFRAAINEWDYPEVKELDDKLDEMTLYVGDLHFFLSHQK